MKVETPQILWNSEGDKGINAALYSVSLVESGFVEDDSGIRKPSYVLATAGNSPDIHLWKIVFAQDESSASSTPSLWQRGRPTQIDFLCRLHRHEGAVNSVAFSPDGLSLATAGETGAVIVWSVPLQKRGNGNGQHWWSHVEREQDLQVRVLSRNAEAVSDISWSADSQRFVAGTIDSAIFVCQATPEGNWETVYRTKEHSHYVQGVAYDPCGVYLASMSNDRTVRVYTRKPPAKSKKKVQRPKEATGAVPPPDFSARVANLLSEARLEMNVRTKQIKHFKQTDSTTGAVLQKHSLFCDEATLQSFFRRLAWTPDGAFLILPACLWQHKMPLDTGSINHTAASQEAPSYATCLFMRHHFDEPYRVLTGLEKVGLLFAGGSFSLYYFYVNGASHSSCFSLRSRSAPIQSSLSCRHASRKISSPRPSCPTVAYFVS
jgi:WD40 repeat protein